jgi:hypothetical protein
MDYIPDYDKYTIDIKKSCLQYHGNRQKCTYIRAVSNNEIDSRKSLYESEKIYMENSTNLKQALSKRRNLYESQLDSLKKK